MIWNQKVQLEKLNNRQNDMASFLEIQFSEITENSLTATMPVTDKVRQPYGILHGGASVVLAETVGSFASSLVVDIDKYMVVGMEINANHLRPVASGSIKAVCTPIHLGKSSHVWDIKIYNDKSQLTCISRLTVAIIVHQKFK